MSKVITTRITRVDTVAFGETRKGAAEYEVQYQRDGFFGTLLALLGVWRNLKSSKTSSFDWGSIYHDHAVNRAKRLLGAEVIFGEAKSVSQTFTMADKPALETPEDE